MINKDKILDLSDWKEIQKLIDFLPLNSENLYFNAVFENLLITDEFYNTAVLHLTHFYNYILHCFLFRLYKDNNNLELLKYLQITTSKLNPNDSSRYINITKDNSIDIFQYQEKEAIKYFLYIFKLDKSAHLNMNNQKIFDIRNSVAHLFQKVVDINQFKDFLFYIKENLDYISKKCYKYTKTIIVKDINLAIKEQRIDASNYNLIFESINKQYYFSINDYILLKNNSFLKNINDNKIKYYISEYINNFLKLE